jgi:transposase
MARPVIMPNPANVTLEELDIAARCTPSQRSGERLRAIKALILGGTPEFVAAVYGVTERTVRRWVLEFNRRGIDGLIEKSRPGRPRAIQKQSASICRELLTHPEQAGRTHWTGVRFHGHLREELGIEVGYSTVIRFLHEEGYRLKVPQPWPDRQDEAQRAAFCRRLQVLVDDPEVDLWFGDEMGVEGDPRPRRRWAKRGEKTRSTKNGDHIRMNVAGIVCPRTGQFFAIEFSHSDRDTFQAFLDEANEHARFERSRSILILDNASWHKAKTIRWGRFEPLYLPPYSPDLNPIERLWLLIKAEWFTNWIAKSHDELIHRLDQALLWVIGRNNENRKTCAIRTEL